MRRTFIFLFISFLSFFQLPAQINKGAVLISNSLKFNTKHENSDWLDQQAFDNTAQSYDFSNNLSLGYFINKNTAVGIAYSFDYFNNTADYYQENNNGTFISIRSSNYNNKVQLHGIGLFMRNNFWLKKNFSFFIEPTVYLKSGYFNGDYKDEYKSRTNSQIPTETIVSNNNNFRDNSITAYGIGLSPGLAYYPKKWLGFELKFGNLAYEFTEEKQKEDFYRDGELTNSNEFKTNSGTTLVNLGLNTFSLGINFLINNSKVTSESN